MENIQKNHFNSLVDYSKKGKFDEDPRIKIMLGELNKILKINPNAKILDVGVADGYIYRELAKKHKIFGVDVSDHFVKKARENGIEAFVCDLENEKLPFNDNFFDVVITGETIEHVVNSDYFLSEINRVSKNDSKLILSYPNINTPLGIIMMIFLDLPPMFAARFRAPHVRDWTKKTIKYALKLFGFKINKILGSGFYLPGIGYFKIFNLSIFFPRLCYSAVVVATKKSLVKYDKSNVIKINL
ncbi:MAG: class I SAM-dependent methyltransferase [Candidatus Staskawiczbacteria bacterium]